MFRTVKRLIALSLPTHREQLEQRTNTTCPRPFLLRPPFLLFLVCPACVSGWVCAQTVVVVWGHPCHPLLIHPVRASFSSYWMRPQHGNVAAMSCQRIGLPCCRVPVCLEDVGRDEPIPTCNICLRHPPGMFPRSSTAPTCPEQQPLACRSTTHVV